MFELTCHVSSTSLVILLVSTTLIQLERNGKSLSKRFNIKCLEDFLLNHFLLERLLKTWNSILI